MFYILYLIIWPFFYIFSLLLFRNTNLSPKKNSFSDLGAKGRNGSYFNISLIIVGIFQLIIFYVFGQRYLLNNLAKIGVVLFTATTLAGILTGIITVKINEKAHLLIGLAGIVCAIVGWILFGISLRQIFFPGFLLMCVWGLVIVPISLLIFVDWKSKCFAAMGEMSIFIGAYVTGLLMLKLILM